MGPYTVRGMDPDHRLIYVQNCEVGPSRLFNRAQVRRYLSPEELGVRYLSFLYYILLNYRNLGDGQILQMEIISLADPRASSKERSKAKKK